MDNKEKTSSRTRKTSRGTKTVTKVKSKDGGVKYKKRVVTRKEGPVTATNTRVNTKLKTSKGVTKTKRKTISVVDNIKRGASGSITKMTTRSPGKKTVSKKREIKDTKSGRVLDYQSRLRTKRR